MATPGTYGQLVENRGGTTTAILQQKLRTSRELVSALIKAGQLPPTGGRMGRYADGTDDPQVRAALARADQDPALGQRVLYAAGLKTPEAVQRFLNSEALPASGTTPESRARANIARGLPAEGVEVPIGYTQEEANQAYLSGKPLTQPKSRGAVDEADRVMKKIYDDGKMINPNANITEKSLAEFLAIAGKEINPYYASQLKLASDSLMKNLGYSQQELVSQEQDLQRKYGRSLRELGEGAADIGFAQSGLRKREEAELASETQKAIETGRRSLQYNAGQAVGKFAQQYGGMEGFKLPGANLPNQPRVLPGESQFAAGESSPYYQLSPSVYSGLVGEQEFARRGAISTRASELEGAKNLSQSLTRTLNV